MKNDFLSYIYNKFRAPFKNVCPHHRRRPPTCICKKENVYNGQNL